MFLGQGKKKKAMQSGKSAQELLKHKWCQGSVGVAGQGLASWSPSRRLSRDQGSWGAAEGTPGPGHLAPSWGQV